MGHLMHMGHNEYMMIYELYIVSEKMHDKQKMQQIQAEAKHKTKAHKDSPIENPRCRSWPLSVRRRKKR